jgi:hypothetical protein
MNDIERYNFWNYEIDSYIVKINDDNKINVEFSKEIEKPINNTEIMIENN